MLFDAETIKAATEQAKLLNVDAAALLAVAEVESAGKVYALVSGRNEPLIRLEGHYFDRRLDHALRAVARRQGLSHPSPGGLKNPSSQQKRYDILSKQMLLDPVAAQESSSWGLGQVMGAHWKWLGFASVYDFVELARRDAGGQIELMGMFIRKAGLAGALRSKDWTTFAKGYNGPGYKVNAYDVKMMSAYARWKKALQTNDPVAEDNTVLNIQKHLIAHGFPVVADGIRGPKTNAAIILFQKAKGLKPDGQVGSLTWGELLKEPS